MQFIIPVFLLLIKPGAKGCTEPLMELMIFPPSKAATVIDTICNSYD